MTLEEFKTGVVPSQGEITFYHTGTPPTVQALNISITSNLGVNVGSSLTVLSKILINIEGTTYTLTVSYVEAYPGYYFVKIQDYTFPSSLFTDGNLNDENSVNPTFFVPNLQDAAIVRSDYNAILNNATFNRTVAFIFDVDRSKYTDVGTRPVNYDTIIAGTATPASFQELNYTSVGLTNSRYGGAKTSEAQYGVSPAFSGISVNGALYTPNQSNGYICSQSLSDRNVEDVIVGYDASASPSFAGSAVYAEDISINYETLAKFIKSSGTIDASATTLDLNAYIDIYPGDIIRIKLGTPEEILKVVSVSSKTSSSTVFTAIRAYKSDVNPDNTAVAITGGAIVTVSRLSSTTVFKTDGNQLYKVSNRKLWVEQNTKVFYIDEGGKVIFELITCSI